MTSFLTIDIYLCKIKGVLWFGLKEQFGRLELRSHLTCCIFCQWCYNRRKNILLVLTFNKTSTNPPFFR